MSVCLTSFNPPNPLMRTGQSTEEFTPYQIGKTLPLVEGTGNADIDRRLVTYTNSMQMRILNFGSRTTFIRAGRGFGKTSVEGLHTIRIAQTIPFGTSIFMGCSIAQLQKKTMPALIKSIEMLSGGRLKEGVHFFRCRPPKAANFPMPLSKPRTYDSLVYFYTGHVIHLVSMEVSATANGMTLAAIISDETRYQNWKKYQEEIRPALRQELFDHPGWNAAKNPFYLSQFFVSDAAILSKQMLWEKEAEKQTFEVNEKISEMLAQLDVCPELQYAQRFINELNRLRGESFKFWNCSTLDNIDILGLDYIKQLQRDMPKLMFDIQILGKKRNAGKDGYYSNFDIEVHGYAPKESDQIDALHSQFDIKHKTRLDLGGWSKEIEYEAPNLSKLEKTDNCSLDTDLDAKVPLCITFDYNKNINTLIVGQHRMMDGLDSCVIVKTMYVTNERKLRALCGDFCRYYEPHRQRNREVWLYYDATAKQGGAYALEEQEQTRFYNVIKDELEKRHWDVKLVFTGDPMRHDDKYRFINDVLAGKGKLFVRICTERNDYLCAALENAQIKLSSSGRIMKDKSGEKKASRIVDDEDPTAGTDVSDAFDEMVIGMTFYANGRKHTSWGLSGIPIGKPITR